MLHLDFIKGQKVRITLTEGDEYEGIVQSVNLNGRSISLFNVKDLSTNLTFPCLYHYMQNEIRNAEVLQEADEVVDKSAKASDVIKIIKYEDLVDKVEVKLNLPKREIDRLQDVIRNYVYVKEVNKVYWDAVHDLKNCETVAVDGKGCDYGRRTQISLLVMASWCTIYVFDIKMLGNPFKDSSDGLRFILEIKDIMKIMHGGVKLTDCLKHNYNTIIKNIFDTQIADILIRHRKESERKEPMLLRSFSECLTGYLDATPGMLNDSIGLSQWNERPLSSEVLQAVGEKVGYLMPLKNKIEVLLNQGFYTDCDRHMNSMVTLDPGDAYYAMSRNSGESLVNEVKAKLKL